MSPRVETLAKALTRLCEALENPETDLTRDASIQRFEFCFELAWKAIQEHARKEGWEVQPLFRSEGRRVGKECRSRGWPEQ